MTGPITDYPADQNYGSTRARSPEDIARMRARHAAGVPIATIAAQFEISERSVQRYLRDDSRTIEVCAGGWCAEFAVASDRPPRRLTAWQRTVVVGPPENQQVRARDDREGR